MSSKIQGKTWDPQKCPKCGSLLYSGKSLGEPMIRWICTKCKKFFSISKGGLGDEIIEIPCDDQRTLTGTF
jgi:ribosomal protein S27AE